MVIRWELGVFWSICVLVLVGMGDLLSVSCQRSRVWKKRLTRTNYFFPLLFMLSDKIYSNCRYFDWLAFSIPYQIDKAEVFYFVESNSSWWIFYFLRCSQSCVIMYSNAYRKFLWWLTTSIGYKKLWKEMKRQTLLFFSWKTFLFNQFDEFHVI